VILTVGLCMSGWTWHAGRRFTRAKKRLAPGLVMLGRWNTPCVSENRGYAGKALGARQFDEIRGFVVRAFQQLPTFGKHRRCRLVGGLGLDAPVAFEDRLSLDGHRASVKHSHARRKGENHRRMASTFDPAGRYLRAWSSQHTWISIEPQSTNVNQPGGSCSHSVTLPSGIVRTTAMMPHHVQEIRRDMRSAAGEGKSADIETAHQVDGDRQNDGQHQKHIEKLHRARTKSPLYSYHSR